ncbi:MAG: cystathionine beta-synthase [Actinomycetota bacterium]|nr:cystathionine beta-synthase [Actinomycetota bacterium]
MSIHPNLLSLVGNTPLVALDRVGAGLPGRLVAKLEMLNPGGSVKDRIAEAMVVAAERSGKLCPGGVIVEPTSGNTGVGLAICAAQRGYRCIFVMPDKMSQEKINLLRAYGAEVVVCPTDVAPDSPRSYYSVARRLAEEVPGAFAPNQYFNQANPEAHYKTTGPELWDQTGGKVDVFVAGVGTGGTITGAGRYLKEKNPDVTVVGADPEGSIYTGPDDIHPYLTEGIGEDFWPETLDPGIVDRWERVSDRDAFLMARRVTREEGILIGGSGGTAVVAAMRVAAEVPRGSQVVVLLPDGGRSYLSKIYNDVWMIQHGFLESTNLPATVLDVISSKTASMPALIHVHPDERLGTAIDIMREYGVSQLPVMLRDDPTSPGDLVGSIRERDLLEVVVRDPSAFERQVAEVMQAPMPVAASHEDVESLLSNFALGAAAVVVVERGRPVGVVTRSDVLSFMSSQRDGR